MVYSTWCWYRHAFVIYSFKTNDATFRKTSFSFNVILLFSCNIQQFYNDKQLIQKALNKFPDFTFLDIHKVFNISNLHHTKKSIHVRKQYLSLVLPFNMTHHKEKSMFIKNSQISTWFIQSPVNYTQQHVQFHFEIHADKLLERN